MAVFLVEHSPISVLTCLDVPVTLQHLRLWTLNQDVLLVCPAFEFTQHGGLSDWCLVDVC